MCAAHSTEAGGGLLLWILITCLSTGDASNKQSYQEKEKERAGRTEPTAQETESKPLHCNLM